MFTVYFGSDPEISLTDNENRANHLADKVIKFKTIKEANDCVEINDNSLSSYPYYSCWRFHTLIFVS